MKFKENIYDFCFYPIKYEFNKFNKDSDLYDLNFIVTRFEFKFKGNKVINESALFTTFEMLNFIIDLENELQNDEYETIYFEPLEPSFRIIVRRMINVFLINVIYNYSELCEENQLDFLLIYTKEELETFINILNKEYLNFNYHRISDYVNNKIFNSFNDVVKTICSNNLITGDIIFNANSLRIKTHEFFNFVIDDAFKIENDKLIYGLRLNKKDLCCIEEENLIDFLTKLYTEYIIVEYVYPKGFCKLKWFDVFKKSDFDMKKFTKNKKILRIFDAKKIYYYNPKYLILSEDLLKKYKSDNLNPFLECVYYSKDNKKRIQIINKVNYYTICLEKFIIFEEANMYTTQNYGYWITIDDGTNHIYDSKETLEKDVEHILIDYYKG